MKEISCCFTGHRQIEPADEPTLKAALKEQAVSLIERDVTQFYCGGALGFDTLAAACILELKQQNSGIRLLLALPCRGQEKYYNKYQKQLYHHIIEHADRVFYTAAAYSAGCMHERNRFMVDNCAYCICYLRKQRGGTKYTAHYAERSGLKVIYL